MLLTDGWARSGAVRWLDPELVLAEAWAPRRLQLCREQLAAGQHAPPIHVVGLRLPQRRVFYSVSDGTHRTVAHREAGKKIKARISGYYLIEPARHVLRQDQIWRRAGSELRWVGDASDELRAILLTLGVADA